MHPVKFFEAMATRDQRNKWIKTLVGIIAIVVSFSLQDERNKGKETVTATV